MLKDLESLLSSSPVRKGHRKLWEISPRFHCSLLGTCATPKELRLVSKRCRIDHADDCNDYDFHAMFVNMADRPSPALRMLQKMLDRRYAAEIRCLSRIQSVEKLSAAWNKALDTGKVSGAYWALMGHPMLTSVLARQAHEDIHMLSHHAIRSQQLSCQVLKEMRQKNNEIKDQLSKTTGSLREAIHERDTALELLKHSMHKARDLEYQYSMTLKRLEFMESGEELVRVRSRSAQLLAENEYLTSHVASLVIERNQYKHTLELAQEKNQALNSLVTSQKGEDGLQSEADIPGNQRQPFRQCILREKPPTQLDLCGRCVLVVGGRTGQCEHFRTLVERHNGRFIHHDGGRENSRQHLGAILPQADVILCPLDSISHDAIKRVKRFCQLHTKHLVFLPRSSLSAFTKGLKEVAA